MKLLPIYFLTSIKVFEEQDNPYANVFNPDGGTAKIDIKKYHLKRLKKATNQNFGYDYEKWKEWWLAEGQYMNYNKKKRVYY